MSVNLLEKAKHVVRRMFNRHLAGALALWVDEAKHLTAKKALLHGGFQRPIVDRGDVKARVQVANDRIEQRQVVGKEARNLCR